VIINPTIIAEPEIELRVDFLHGICRLERFGFEVVQSMPEISTDPGICLLAKPLSLLKVMCGPKRMARIPLF
jgi:hypothetical protein